MLVEYRYTAVCGLLAAVRCQMLLGGVAHPSCTTIYPPLLPGSACQEHYVFHSPLLSCSAALQYCPRGADKVKVLKDMIFPLVSCERRYSMSAMGRFWLQNQLARPRF